MQDSESKKINYDIHRRIMKFSIRNVRDLKVFWYTSDIFQELLDDMSKTEDIWEDAITRSYQVYGPTDPTYFQFFYVDFLPLGYVLKYFFEKGKVNIREIEEFSKVDRGTNLLPKYIFENFPLKSSFLSDRLEWYFEDRNYEMAGFLIENGVVPFADSGYIVWNKVSNNKMYRKTRPLFSRFGRVEIAPKDENLFLTKCFNDGQVDFLRLIIDKVYKELINVKLLNTFLLSFRRTLVTKKTMIETIKIFSEFTDISDINLSILFMRGKRCERAFSEIFPFVYKFADLTKRYIHNLDVPSGTLLDIICIRGSLSDLKILIEYGIDISDPSLSSINLIEAVNGSKSKNKDEMISILESTNH
jgi:hypothetical protein